MHFFQFFPQVYPKYFGQSTNNKSIIFEKLIDLRRVMSEVMDSKSAITYTPK